MSVRNTSQTTALKLNIATVFWEEQHTKEKESLTLFLQKPPSVPQVKRNASERRRKNKERREVSPFDSNTLVILIFIGKLT